MLSRLISIVLIVHLAVNCRSQEFDASNFRVYTTNDGLTDNKIVGVVQDSAGYIWIATLHGLNRFDGNIFKSFLKTSRHNPLPDNAIYSMKLLGNELAVATDDGAQIISTNTLTQKNMNAPTTAALHYWANASRYVSVDKDGNYGVSTKTGFFIFSPHGQLRKRFDYYTEKDIGRAWMMFGGHLYQLPDGNLMQQNSNGLLIYDRAKNIIGDIAPYYPAIKNIYPALDNHHLFMMVSSNNLLVINVDKNRFDLIDVRNGSTKSFPACFQLRDEVGWQTTPSFLHNNLLSINCRTKGFFLLKIDTTARTISCSPKKYFPDHVCSAIFQDRENRLWVGTDNGLYSQRTQPNIFSSFNLADNSSPGQLTVTSLFIARDKLFVGTSDKTILLIDKLTKKIVRKVQLSRHKLLSNDITGFEWLHGDTLLVSTSSGLHWFNTKNFSTGDWKIFDDSNYTVSSMLSDKANNIWILNNRINSVYYYSRDEKTVHAITDKTEKLLKINQANSVAEDNKGNIWFGGDALARWNPHRKRIDTLIERLPTQKNWKKGFFVMSDSKGDVWAIVNDDGVARITGPPIHLRADNLLVDNGGASPTLINDKVFMPTTNLLGYLDLRTSKAIIFHHAEGLPNKPITTLQFAKDTTDGSTWFACENILCQFPAAASAYYKRPPVLSISEVTVINDTLINYPQDIVKLRYDQNDIRVTVSAINFIDPENMRFAYRISNKQDSSWIEGGNQPNILLTNISPGDYKLQVKLYAYDNKWPDQIKELEISIRPPFWKSWWFLLIVSLALATAIFLFYKSRISQVRKKASIDRQLAEFEIKALHAQMNPHFIFNCLNSIREMILNNENQQASHYLSKFAHLIRITLNQSSRPFISLKNTIDYLQRYLEMEKIRMAHFSYTIHVDRLIPQEDIFLPPMLIQPFIENAIWHGGWDQNKILRLDIRFVRRDGKLLCIVEDNGIGIKASWENKKEGTVDHNSIGIANVRQRIGVLNEKYNLNSRVTIEDKSDLPWYNEPGTIVTLYLAIKNNLS